jgi:hypothetical protein
MYMVREYAGGVLLVLMLAAPLGALLLLLWGGQYSLGLVRALRRALRAKRLRQKTSRRVEAEPISTSDGPS